MTKSKTFSSTKPLICLNSIQVTAQSLQIALQRHKVIRKVLQMTLQSLQVILQRCKTKAKSLQITPQDPQLKV